MKLYLVLFPRCKKNENLIIVYLSCCRLVANYFILSINVLYQILPPIFNYKYCFKFLYTSSKYLYFLVYINLFSMNNPSYVLKYALKIQNIFGFYLLICIQKHLLWNEGSIRYAINILLVDMIFTHRWHIRK